MQYSGWFRRFLRRASVPPGVKRRRFGLELLEDRLALSIFSVVNTNDSGPGSLRQAILDANAVANVGGPDLIDFAIPGTGVQTISPLSALPEISDPVIVNGYTQPGAMMNTSAAAFNGTLLIELEGTNAGSGANGLQISAGGSTVRGLVINRFGGNGIVLENEGIGLPATGGNTITGNIIGLDPAGTTDLGNLGHGVVASRSNNNSIGGAMPALRNVISGNRGDGIHLDESGSTMNTVSGNLIGTDCTGEVALGNSSSGVWIGNLHNTVGGLQPGAGNLISGNTFAGVIISGHGATMNRVAGNRIGTDVDGNQPLGNNTGVHLGDFAFNNIIGGDDDDDGASDGIVLARNIVSANNRGILLGGNSTTGNFVRGNFIGTDITGTIGLGNHTTGIFLVGNGGGPKNNIIGGTAAGAGNVIAFNGGEGVLVHGERFFADAGSSRNAIVSNSIFSNGRLGIDLTSAADLLGDGVTPNDPGDADIGPNSLQNFPVLSPAEGDATQVTVSGTLRSTTGGTFRIELFANAASDPSGFGEGQMLIDAFTLTDSDNDGVVSFIRTVSGNFGGRLFTSTATNTSTNDTSEFSPAVAAQPEISISDVTVTEGNTGMVHAVFQVTLSRSTNQAVSVFFSTADNTADGTDYQPTSGSLFFMEGATTQLVTILVNSDTLDEPDETFLVNLSGAVNATIADGQSVGTILDDDPTPSLSISDVTVTEGNSGTVEAVFAVMLSEPSGQTVTVMFATAEGTALSFNSHFHSADFTPTAGFVTFAPLQVSQTITVHVFGDRLPEPDEVFFVNLSDATNAAIADGQGVGTIKDDDSEAVLVSGADAGGGPHVRVFGGNGEERFGFFAFAPNFTGGVRVAMGDVTGDGTPDVVTAAGAGGGPHVRVFDGVTGQQVPGAIGSFFAYDASFSGGVFVAAADFNGDGRADVVTGAGSGGGPHIRVFSGADGSELVGFMDPPKGGNGVRVATGDINGDGTPDIITGSGAGINAVVRVFGGLTAEAIAGPLGSISPYPGFRGGVYVASGDVNGDGRDDVITGAGAGGGPHVRAFSGVDGSELASFFAYDAMFSGGVRVGVGDVDQDGDLEIVSGAGPGGGPHVRAFDVRGDGEVASFFAFNAAFAGGVFVAGSPSAAFVPAAISSPNSAAATFAWLGPISFHSAESTASTVQADAADHVLPELDRLRPRELAFTAGDMLFEDWSTDDKLAVFGADAPFDTDFPWPELADLVHAGGELLNSGKWIV